MDALVERVLYNIRLSLTDKELESVISNINKLYAQSLRNSNSIELDQELLRLKESLVIALDEERG